MSDSKNMFCAIILSYGFVPQIKEVIASVKPLKTFILNPNTSWWDKDMPDQTKDLCKGEDVEIVHGEFNDETEARNFSIQLAKERGYKYAIILDSDEVLGGLKYLLEDIEKNPVESYRCRIVDYMDINMPLPERNHRPLVAVDTDANEEEHYFYDKRCYHGANHEVDKRVVINHYSLLNEENFKYKLNAEKYDDAFPPVEYREIYGRI